MTSENIGGGLTLAIVAGLMSGNCMLPSKFFRVWRWENMWAVFSIFSLVLLPVALALVFVHPLLEVYRSLPISALLIPFGFGAGWGVAQILFGISIDRLGVSLAYSIVVGMGAALGTVVPLLATAGHSITRKTALAASFGIALMITGLIFIAVAGRWRDEVSGEGPIQGQRNGYRTALVLAVLCGFLAPMLNYSFAFGQSIALRSITFGNSPLKAAYAVWPIGLAGGFIANAVYSVYLLFKNGSWFLFRSSPGDFARSCAMALLWMGAFAVYGMSAAMLGPLGTSIGWGLFQVFMILAASLSGLLMGEWKRVATKGHQSFWMGMSLLVAATVSLAFAN
jgi:L-rhamnose-H+ transport protein